MLLSAGFVLTSLIAIVVWVWAKPIIGAIAPGFGEADRDSNAAVYDKRPAADPAYARLPRALGGNAMRRSGGRLPADSCGGRYGGRTRDFQIHSLVLSL